METIQIITHAINVVINTCCTFKSVYLDCCFSLTSDELTLRGYKLRRDILISSGVKNGQINLSLKRSTAPIHNGSMIRNNKDEIINMLNAQVIKDIYAKNQNVSSIKDQINEDKYGRKVINVNENQEKQNIDEDQPVHIGRKLSWLDQGVFVPGVFRWERSGPIQELQRVSFFINTYMLHI